MKMSRVTSCIFLSTLLVCTLASESNSTESTSLATTDVTSASIASSSSVTVEVNSEMPSTISPISSSTGEILTDNGASLKPSTISTLITSTVEETSTAAVVATSGPTTTTTSTTTTAPSSSSSTTTRRTTTVSTSTTESSVEETTAIELTGVCYIKAWGSVAICRTNFVNRLEGKDDAGKCCLYNLLTECAHTGARKLCGEYTEYATAKWLAKYHKMIDHLDCTNVDTNSFTCFWISWENYVSVLLFLIVTIIMLVYVARWYYRGGIGKV